MVELGIAPFVDPSGSRWGGPETMPNCATTELMQLEVSAKTAYK